MHKKEYQQVRTEMCCINGSHPQNHSLNSGPIDVNSGEMPHLMGTLGMASLPLTANYKIIHAPFRFFWSNAARSSYRG